MSDHNRKDSVKEKLAAHPVFRSLSSEALETLVTAATIFYLDAGETLYEANVKAHHVFAILDGAIQIEYPKPGETRGVVMAMLAAPSILGECQVLHERPWSGTGVAVRSVIAIGVGVTLLEQTILQNPVFGVSLYREVTLRFLNAIDTWKGRPELSVEEQLARYIAGALEATAQADSLPFNQTQLGTATGLRRETINRVLSRWEKAGLLKTGTRGLTAIDRAGLEGIAGVLGVTLVQRLDTRSHSFDLGGQ